MPERNTEPRSYDDVVVGGGHNGLVAACYLALAGRRVCVLEAGERTGGAAVSEKVFPGVDARLSKYSYLLSLFPAKIRKDLGIRLRTARREISSYTPDPGDPSRGLLIPSENSFSRFTGSGRDARAWETFHQRISTMAGPVFASLTEPLRTRREFRAIAGDPGIWNDFFVHPIGEVIESTFADDVVRGIVLTDALIGTFSHAHDPSLNQNICFLYHVIGNGTGNWEVPLGGMGALTDALAERARGLGVEILVSSPVTGIESDGSLAEITYLSGDGENVIRASTVLANCAPAVLRRLLGETESPPIPAREAGAQIKVNMLLKRLPKLKDRSVDPADAFRGTFHINESYRQLNDAFVVASSGRLPDPLPLEIYCHSLTDPRILGPELREAGAQTLTVFALQTPHHLFTGEAPVSRKEALSAVIASLNQVLAEPVEECLWLDSRGEPCIGIHTTADIEEFLRIPSGNIFHTPLDRPFTDDPGEAGTWGVSTSVPNIIQCGSSARRGGGVSGIPGHNAARHVLQYFG